LRYKLEIFNIEDLQIYTNVLNIFNKGYYDAPLVNATLNPIVTNTFASKEEIHT